MKRRAIIAIAALAGAAGIACAAFTQEPASASAEIILVGDSTVTPQVGWGGVFCGRHVAAGVDCRDRAIAGRSSGSYIAEGAWDRVVGEIEAGRSLRPLVLIQFGINDATGAPAIRCDPETVFPANLHRFVADVRAAGGRPVLVTTLARRRFREGHFADDLQPWAEATRRVARETGTPLLDLHTLSLAAFDRIGKARITSLGIPGTEGRDDTHLGPDGAILIATLVAHGLRETVPAAGPLLRD